MLMTAMSEKILEEQQPFYRQAHLADLLKQIRQAVAPRSVDELTMNVQTASYLQQYYMDKIIRSMENLVP